MCGVFAHSWCVSTVAAVWLLAHWAIRLSGAARWSSIVLFQSFIFNYFSAAVAIFNFNITVTLDGLQKSSFGLPHSDDHQYRSLEIQRGMVR